MSPAARLWTVEYDDTGRADQVRDEITKLSDKPRGREPTTKPLIYHETLLDFVMVCNGLQGLATLE